MKRIVILAGAITLLVGTSVFGKGMDTNEAKVKENPTYIHSTHMMKGGKHKSGNCHNGRMGHMQNKEMEANRIAIMEKKVELRKEMLKDNPDWNKIEKINKEIANKKAENHTIMMKNRINTNS